MSLLTNSIAYDVVALFATVTVIVYAYFKWSYLYWKRRNVPYFEPKIPFGNFPNPLTNKLSLGEHIGVLYSQAKARGWKTCGLFAMAVPTYMLLDLDMVKHVMTKDFNNFTDRGLYINEKEDPLSANLFGLSGTKWKNLRVKLTPTFTSGKMKMMFQTMADCGVILEKYIKDEVAGKQVVDIKDILGRFSTDIIGSCAFGLECNSFEQPNSPFRVYGKKVLASTTLDLVKDAFTLSFPNAAKALGLRVFKKDICDFYSKVVEDTISPVLCSAIFRIPSSTARPGPTCLSDIILTMGHSSFTCIVEDCLENISIWHTLLFGRRRQYSATARLTLPLQ